MKTAPTVSPEGHVVLLYEGGNTCGDKDGSKYSAKIHIICNRVMVCAYSMCYKCVCMHVCMCMWLCVSVLISVFHRVLQCL